jgi:hypothetical protein
MPSYSFTGPNGEKFEVKAANGVTEADARKIFDQQFNSGALKNLGIGQALAGTTGAAKQATAALAGLDNLPIKNPVNAAQVLKQIPATKSIGSLNPQQVTGMLGQAAAAVAQPASAISATKGIGQFGLTPKQLEEQGFVKPGTVSSFGSTPTVTDQDRAEAEKINAEGGDITPEQVASNRQLNKVLSSPFVWAGKSSVTNLDGFLKNTNIQAATQTNLMSQGLDKLKSLGVASGKESADKLAGLVQGSAKLGPQAVADWAAGKAPPNIADQIGGICKGGQQAADLVANKLPKIDTAPAGAVETVKRAGVDSAVNSAVDDPKVPPIEYGPVEREAPAPDPNADKRDEFDRLVEEAIVFLDGVNAQFDALMPEAKRLDDLGSAITTAEIDAYDAKYQAVRSLYNDNRKKYIDPIIAFTQANPGVSDLAAYVKPYADSLIRLINILQKRSAINKELIALWRSRVQS